MDALPSPVGGGEHLVDDFPRGDVDRIDPARRAEESLDPIPRAADGLTAHGLDASLHRPSASSELMQVLDLGRSLAWKSLA